MKGDDDDDNGDCCGWLKDWDQTAIKSESVSLAPFGLARSPIPATRAHPPLTPPFSAGVGSRTE